MLDEGHVRAEPVLGIVRLRIVFLSTGRTHVLEGDIHVFEYVRGELEVGGILSQKERKLDEEIEEGHHGGRVAGLGRAAGRNITTKQVICHIFKDS